MITLAFRGRHALLRFSRRRWRELTSELGRRGEGRRESGAFLLARRDGDSRTVRRTVFLDDLDPDSLQGCICFHGLAYGRLWDVCDAERLVVIGDAHTHPGPGVRQSSIDAENPMIARQGHIALIIPRFSVGRIKPSEVGLHEYLGDDGWSTWTGAEAAKRLHVRQWL